MELSVRPSGPTAAQSEASAPAAAPTPSPTSAITPAPAPETTAPRFVDQAPISDSKAPQLINDINEGVKSGRITQEQADAYLREEGVDPAKAKPALNPNSFEAIIERDFPPARAEEFSLPPMVRSAGEYGPEEHAVDLRIRNGLVTGGFSAMSGSSLAAEIDRVADEVSKMSPVQFKAFEDAEMKAQQRNWGDKTNTNVAMASRLLASIDAEYPGWMDFFAKTRVGKSATVTAMLYQQAKINEMRKGKK